jgi:hypothetical protein
VAPVLATLRNRPGPYGNAMTQGVPVPIAAPKDPATEELRAVAGDLLSVMGVKVGWSNVAKVKADAYQAVASRFDRRSWLRSTAAGARARIEQAYSPPGPAAPVFRRAGAGGIG